jgi:hypothetical protein
VRQRRDTRRELRRPVDVKATVSMNGQRLTARTRDISRSGICLISDHEIPKDTELKIDLVLSLSADTTSEPLVVTGRAIWCTPLFGKFQVGAIFVRVDGERRRFLDLFMRFIDVEVNPVGHEPAHDPADLPPPPEDKDDPFRP